MADPTTLSEEYTFSLQLSALLIALIIQQSDDLGEQQHEIRADLRNERRARQNNIAATVKLRLPLHLQRAAELASIKLGNYTTDRGTWLCLHKGAFQDALSAL